MIGIAGAVGANALLLAALLTMHGAGAVPGEEDPEDNGVVDAVGGMNENLGTILERIFAANEQAANSLRQSAEIEAQRSVMKSATEQRSALFGRELVR
jgi:hypothetical protein